MEELHDRAIFVVESPPRSSDGGRWSINTKIDAQSWPDRGLIVGLFEAKFKLIHRGFEATMLINRNHLDDASIPSPRPHQSVTIFGAIFLIKACISLLCFLTFDRFMKELSKFRGRSLVHCDPLAFRLDCNAIGAGLIANFSLISSNLPLEFRTSARKNPSKFASIYVN